MKSDIFKKENLTIPNFLSAYRLLSFPIILYLVLTKRETAFVVLFSINLLTDILDGFIARTFNQMTPLGARLDSLADVGTFILAFAGVYFFHWEEILKEPQLFFTFLGLYFFITLIGYLKFGQNPSLHLYSFKIAGYFLGAFFFVLFIWGFYPLLYRISLGAGILASLEEIAVLFVLKKMVSNARGLYWVLKNK